MYSLLCVICVRAKFTCSNGETLSGGSHFGRFPALLRGARTFSGRPSNLPSKMSVNPYRRKPASLQLIPACAVLDDEIVTSTSQIPRAPEVTGQHIEVLFKKSYPLETIAIQASSPTRSTSRLNGTTTTTGHTTSRNKSPTRTAFVTIVKTTISPEEANETPPATKTVFFSTTPQIVLVTVTAVPSTTTSAGSLQAQDSEEGSENAPALTQTAKVFLTVLSAIGK